MSLDCPDVMTVAQAASVVQVDDKTIRAAINRGDLHAVRLGRCIRVTRFALENFLGIGAASVAAANDDTGRNEEGRPAD